MGRRHKLIVAASTTAFLLACALPPSRVWASAHVEVAELGSRREMNHIERILHEGTGADRQIAVWERTHDMKAVVDHIVAETYEGLTEVELEKRASVA